MVESRSHEISGELPRFRDALLAWFDRERRDLPWRRSSDPYAILLSEFMLQQTRVETVIPYYHRFLERFPDPEALASAAVDEVLALWSGLGYYSRARRLHALAGRLGELGEWPRTARGLQELPGIGPYTAAAVASIAFGQAVAVVDGNVERVLSRIDALETIAKSSAGKRAIGARAQEILDRERPGDANQAVMELGATVCLPRKPRCTACPWSDLCRAYERGEQERFPIKAEKKRASVEVAWTFAWIREAEGILLLRRPEDDALLAGTWEPPWVEGHDGDLQARFAARYGGSWQLGRELGEVRHSITYRKIRVRVLEASWQVEDAVGEGREAGYFSNEDLPDLPLSSLVAKALKKAARQT